MSTYKAEFMELSPENGEFIEKMKKTSAKRQYYVALFTNLLAFSYGASCGWNC